LRLIAVQHHHAHIAACMAEHALDGPVIGLSLDGTGYGTDGRIWGGEVLVCTLDGFERFAHLDYVPMPGGDAAVREPWRMAVGHLHAAGFDPVAARSLGVRGATELEGRVIRRMLERKLNSPLTSSLGRLFDAVAAVILGRRTVDFEAQAAIELEGLAADEDNEMDAGDYALRCSEGNWATREPITISATAMWHALVKDQLSGKRKARMAGQFHAGVANGFAEAALAARQATGIGTVAMSGGVMHNRRLSRLLRTSLEAQGFRVFQHRRVSPGDGGLSYGQAAVAAAILKKD
jgi:hydrogenase maturation protein HypF